MRGIKAGREAGAADNDGSGGPGGQQPGSPEAGEQDLKILIGPSFALRPQRRTDVANQKSSGANTAELIFAPAAAALFVITNEKGEDTGVPLANAGFDPGEPRIPSGQPGGGQWSAADAGGVDWWLGRSTPDLTADSSSGGGGGGGVQLNPKVQKLMQNLAKNHLNKNYSYHGTAPKVKGLNGFPADRNKCNKFVNDMLSLSGFPVPQINGRGNGPRAGDWASTDPNAVPGYHIVKIPQPGDIAAYPLSGGGADYSGHCGIVGPDGKVVSAHDNRGPDVGGEIYTTEPTGFAPPHPVVYRRPN